jgi:hypothetical protein
MLGWVFVALLFCWFNYKTNKSPNYWNYTGVGCFGTTPLWFNVLNVGTCIGLAIIFFYALLFSKMDGNSSFTVTGVLVVSLFANVALTLNVFVINRKYEVRDCLISLRPIIGNKVVIEGFPLSYQLYSNCKPALNGYDIDFIDKPNNTVFNEMLMNKQADYVIDKVMQGSSLYHSGYTGLTLVKVFNFECYSYYLYKNSLE